MSCLSRLKDEMRHYFSNWFFFYNEHFTKKVDISQTLNKVNKFYSPGFLWLKLTKERDPTLVSNVRVQWMHECMNEWIAAKPSCFNRQQQEEKPSEGVLLLVLDRWLMRTADNSIDNDSRLSRLSMGGTNERKVWELQRVCGEISCLTELSLDPHLWFSVDRPRPVFDWRPVKSTYRSANVRGDCWQPPATLQRIRGYCGWM